MKLPSFGGGIRSYGRFKSDFKRQVEPHTRVEDLAYTLKSCLTREALKAVECVDDKFNEMWNRLSAKFGRPSLLVDAIFSRLKIEKVISSKISLSIIEERLLGKVRREKVVKLTDLTTFPPLCTFYWNKGEFWNIKWQL